MKISTINRGEIDKFSKIANEWWDPEGKFKPLHKFNPIRIQYIKENITKHFNINKKNLPLRNLKILDYLLFGFIVASGPLTKQTGLYLAFLFPLTYLLLFYKILVGRTHLPALQFTDESKKR